VDTSNVSTLAEGLPHVLMITNHLEAQKQFPFAGVFVDSQVASLQHAGVTISTFDIGTSHSPFIIFRKCLELRKSVRKLNPQLVHGQYGTIVGIATIFAGRPAVLSFCGYDLLPGAPVSRLRMYLGLLLSNLAALRARCLICKSEELRQALWWCHSRAVVIPNGVDLDLFSPGSQDEARHALGWDLKIPIVIMNVSRDVRNKGLDVAKAAMKVVQRRMPEAKLHVISNVKHTKMPIYYRAADVLLCASKQEGSPNVVKEALACNLPVVSTPVGDVVERLAGVHPSVVVPREPQLMAEALTKILLTRARSNGRERIAHLSLAQVAQQVLDVYRTALACSAA
jgi:teichuronic acid biosynthesis glycosyltransferase TuaC